MFLRRFLPVFLLVLLSACAALPQATAEPAIPTRPVPEQTPLPPAPTLPATPLEIPAEFQPAREAVAQAAGVSSAEVILVSVEDVQWPDACLGAASPSEMCAQVLSPGYRLIFQTPSQVYEVHTDQSGQHFRLLPPWEERLTESSGIMGLVLLGPACPGPERLNQPCPDKPFETALTVLDASGKQAAEIKSDAQGRFILSLPPGEYIIHPAATEMMPSAADMPVTVKEGQYTWVLISYDSGIR